jgi:hypothetical protein
MYLKNVAGSKGRETKQVELATGSYITKPTEITSFKKSPQRSNIEADKIKRTKMNKQVKKAWSPNPKPNSNL